MTDRRRFLEQRDAGNRQGRWHCIHGTRRSLQTGSCRQLAVASRRSTCKVRRRQAVIRIDDARKLPVVVGGPGHERSIASGLQSSHLARCKAPRKSVGSGAQSGQSSRGSASRPLTMATSPTANASLQQHGIGPSRPARALNGGGIRARWSPNRSTCRQGEAPMWGGGRNGRLAPSRFQSASATHITHQGNRPVPTHRTGHARQAPAQAQRSHARAHRLSIADGFCREVDRHDLDSRCSRLAASDGTKSDVPQV